MRTDTHPSLSAYSVSTVFTWRTWASSPSSSAAGNASSTTARGTSSAAPRASLGTPAGVRPAVYASVAATSGRNVASSLANTTSASHGWSTPVERSHGSERLRSTICASRPANGPFAYGGGNTPNTSVPGIEKRGAVTSMWWLRAGSVSAAVSPPPVIVCVESTRYTPGRTCGNTNGYSVIVGPLIAPSIEPSRSRWRP